MNLWSFTTSATTCGDVITRTTTADRNSEAQGDKPGLFGSLWTVIGKVVQIA